jgi:hypothetical protein
VGTVTSYDSISFTAGKDAGARISACVARFAAFELVEESHWWNRWRHRLMAKALVACAEELESNADESERHGSSQPQDRAEAASA